MAKRKGYVTLKANIDDIKIPEEFKKKKPKAYKILGMKQWYKTYGCFYGTIIIDEKWLLRDGYVIYYVAKLLQIKEVPVKIIKAPNIWQRIFKKGVTNNG